MGESGRYLTALRRGVALGVVLAMAWGCTRLSGCMDLGDRLMEAGEDAQAAAVLMTGRLGMERGERALEGWGRLLLRHAPLLAAGEGAVLRLRAQGTPAPAEEQQSPEDGDGDDQEEPQLLPETGEDGIFELTARGNREGKYLYGEGVYLYNRTNLELDASVLSQGQVDVPLGDGPQILIVHTHGSEAYSRTDGDDYEESDPYRTTDCTHNVVRVGAEMATVFRAHGFQVIHDTTLFDYPAYNGAYERSKAAVEQWMKQYPTIRVVLDVHRDALVGKNGEVYKLVSKEAGKTVAQVMLVVGSSGSGAEHPRWKDNLAFAVRLQQGLDRGYESLARPMVLRNSRYNQQLSTGSLLVEVGGHGNTLTEALEGARLWADNVARTLIAMKAET